MFNGGKLTLKGSYTCSDRLLSWILPFQKKDTRCCVLTYVGKESVALFYCNTLYINNCNIMYIINTVITKFKV